MDSFYYLINRYSLQLHFAQNFGKAFDQDGNLVDAKAEVAKASKAQVIHRMYMRLKEAPVYYLNPDLLKTFQSRMVAYTEAGLGSRDHKISMTVSAIEILFTERAEKVGCCFCGEGGKVVNDILDKKPEEMSEDDYSLIFYLCNYFAYKRKNTRSFLKYAAIKTKLNELHHDHENLIIENGENKVTYTIRYLVPKDTTDLVLFLHIQMASRGGLNSSLEQNEALTREMLRRKVVTKDEMFRRHLDTHLLMFAIDYLINEGFSLLKDRIELEELSESFRKGCETMPHFVSYVKDFIREPKKYHEYLVSDAYRLPILPDGNDEVTRMARELLEWVCDHQVAFDRWYVGMYKKIQAYQRVHADAALPMTCPAEYKKMKVPIGLPDIEIPVLNRLKQWESEERAALDRSHQTSPQGKTQQSQKKKRTHFHKTKAVSDPDLENIDPPSAGGQQESHQSERSLEEGRYEGNTSDAIPERDSQQETLLKRQLEESSPFRVHARILDWFDPSSKVTLLNEESRLIHNFAWAANAVIWSYGMRYYRKTDSETPEPAIAMLCQMELGTFKPTLFRVTLTFRGEGKKPPFNYHSRLNCYHRTLTRREQEEQDVEDYFALVRERFVEFPPLPTQAVETDCSELSLDKVYPDGSFIEAVNGSVVTVRDPKNDQATAPCRFKLFILRN